MTTWARWRVGSRAAIGLALIAAVAIAGTAIGGQGATIAVKKKAVKKLIRKEVAKQIGKATGPPGANGLNGANAFNGANGADGTARAYGRVRSHDFSNCAPTCQLVRSRGIRSVTRSAVGDYCVNVDGIAASQVSPAVSVDFTFTNPPQGNASVLSADSLCATDDFSVITLRQPSTEVCTNDACSTTAFVAGEAVPADDVSFTIVIP